MDESTEYKIVGRAPVDAVGAMPPYEALLAEASQISYHNTVVVRSRDDTWWLGYIQDIDGEQAFIHFNCTLVAAHWVHMSAVWPLPYYWDTELASKGHHNIPVFAALRDDDDGPFRFRPAVLLDVLCNYGVLEQHLTFEGNTTTDYQTSMLFFFPVSIMDESTEYKIVGRAPVDAVGAMPPYEALLAEASQISYHNTVVVRSRDDTWWLGYIQDIDGEQAFIHFNCTLVAAHWVHMSAVWPLPYYWDTELASKGHHNIPVFAALRDDDDGPFRFRPAVLLDVLFGCQWGCQMFCITTRTGTGVAHSNVPPRTAGLEVVHVRQVASELPPSGPPLLERRSGVFYTKHFVPFGRAQSLLCEPSDKHRIVRHIYEAIRAKLGLTANMYAPDCCRFHLRIEEDGCMFVFVSLATDVDPDAQPTQTQTHWLAGSLATILETHLASRAHLPPIHKDHNQAATANRQVFCEIGVPEDAVTWPARIRDLTPSLLSDILSHLDLHSRMKAKRVCALWQLLLSSCGMTEHVSISFESCWHLQADGDYCLLQTDNDNCFRAASLLSRSISTTTISLTLLTLFPPHDSAFLRPLLRAMEIRLPLLVLKDHVIINGEARGFQRHKRSRLKHAESNIITLYKHNANFVCLHNWKVSQLFGQQMHEVFVGNIYYKPQAGVTTCSLPAHEREWMVPLACQSQAPQLAVDQLQITIPKLLLPCSRKMRMTSRFMCALNDNFPPVTPDMLAKVTAVHARWLRTLTYPEDWQRIRDYLLLYSGFRSDGSPTVWDGIDLRRMDVSTWSKMAIYGINEVFRV
ncbi:uncharacterized protein LOC129598310 [Paramacrobiotus metropolitanus]|uniref:uncharacterized protein LOC129598310 n=1 Tax=Paramacrobiotus metropolitanus TaxID=2943436 RepID=UPI002445B792|nr:uncharacterized protein LOC129598310 [Paramacrobiotus metropolitanus]